SCPTALAPSTSSSGDRSCTLGSAVRPHEGHGLREAVLEVRPRSPAERLYGEPRIKGAPSHISLPRGAERRLAGEPRDGGKEPEQAVDGGLEARTNVHETTVATFRREREGVNDVVDEHVIAGLIPITVDRRRPAGQHRRREDRDDPGLALRNLTRAVDVGEREGGERDAVLPFVEAEVVDAYLLADPVRRHRSAARRFLDGQLPRFAIERAPGGGVDNLAYAGLHTTAHQVQQPHHVDRSVPNGILHRTRNGRLRGQVHQDLGAMSLEQGEQALRTDIHVEEGELIPVASRLAEVGDPTGRQVVHRDDPMSFGEQAIAQVRTDEPGAPRDQDGGHPSSSEGSAPTPRDVRSPRSSLQVPATAIIAPLSVHRSNDGNSTRDPDSAPAFSIRSRNRVLATTPPPSRTVSTPRPRAASIVLSTWTSTMASWNDAARSAGSTSRPAWRSALTCRSTAVFRPDSEKSRSPESAIARGNRIAFGSPPRASRSRAGPPGNPSPRNRAILSNASPAASSTVCPRSSCRWGSGVWS